jgi:hypothetical protein
VKVRRVVIIHVDTNPNRAEAMDGRHGTRLVHSVHQVKDAVRGASSIRSSDIRMQRIRGFRPWALRGLNLRLPSCEESPSGTGTQENQ